MSRSRRSARGLGTAYETAVAKYLSVELGMSITRRVKEGKRDPGDIAGVTINSQPVAIECKNPGKNSSIEVSQWWSEVMAARENIGAIGSVLLVKQYGKPLGESYAVVDDSMVEFLSPDMGNIVEHDKTLPVSQWKNHITSGTIIKTFKHGKKGQESWYFTTLDTITTMFDSMNDIPQVFLGDLDIFLLKETGSAVVTSTQGQSITVNLVDGVTI